MVRCEQDRLLGARRDLVGVADWRCSACLGIRASVISLSLRFTAPRLTQLLSSLTPDIDRGNGRNDEEERQEHHCSTGHMPRRELIHVESYFPSHNSASNQPPTGPDERGKRAVDREDRRRYTKRTRDGAARITEAWTSSSD